MAETKGRKIYILLSENDVVGLWSNLLSLTRDFNNGSTLLSYHKIYRHLKTHLDNDDVKTFCYDFIFTDGKQYRIKVENLQ